MPEQDIQARISAGVFPAGISYADREIERNGDFAKLAFLDFATLTLTFDKLCPEIFKPWINQAAAAVQACKGQPYQVSTSGQTVTLGWRLK